MDHIILLLLHHIIEFIYNITQTDDQSPRINYGYNDRMTRVITRVPTNLMRGRRQGTCSMAGLLRTRLL